MLTKAHLSILALALLATLPADQPSPEKPVATERILHLHRDLDAAAFFELPKVGEPMKLGDLDHALLSAAIFHETNRRRAEHDLRPLQYLPELREAALLQVRGMLKLGSTSHRHPDPDLRMLDQRFRAVGLKPRFMAENVARVFALDYEAGATFHVREEDGETILSHEADGPPIPVRSYAAFARHLLDGWMNSPGHRRNILHKEPDHLGTAALLWEKAEGPQPAPFFCAQEFFSPFPESLQPGD